MRHTVIVPIARVNRTVAATLAFAVSLIDHVMAVHVTDDPDAGEQLRRQWRAWGTGIQLVILRSLYRHVLSPRRRNAGRVHRAGAPELA
jgi:hypothetical protein